MKRLLPFVIALFPLSAAAITPVISGPIEFENREPIEQPPQNARQINIDKCADWNTQISPNPDGTIDLVFLNFAVATSKGMKSAFASCGLSIPIEVPEGMQVEFTKLGLEGMREIPQGGSAVFKAAFGLKNQKMTSFGKPFSSTGGQAKAFDLSARAQGPSPCGGEVVELDVQIFLAARRGDASEEETSISVDEGAVGPNLKYVLNYKPCRPSHDNPWQHRFQIQYSNPRGQIVKGTMTLNGQGGEYQTEGDDVGKLFAMKYSSDYKTVEGLWQFENGKKGWFRFSLVEPAKGVFKGTWGNGHAGSPVAGTWQGRYQ